MSSQQRKGGSSEEAPLVSGDWRTEHEPDVGAEGEWTGGRGGQQSPCCRTRRLRPRPSSRLALDALLSHRASGLIGKMGTITPAMRGFNEQYPAHTSHFYCCQSFSGILCELDDRVTWCAQGSWCPERTLPALLRGAEVPRGGPARLKARPGGCHAAAVWLSVRTPVFRVLTRKWSVASRLPSPRARAQNRSSSLARSARSLFSDREPGGGVASRTRVRAAGPGSGGLAGQSNTHCASSPDPAPHRHSPQVHLRQAHFGQAGEVLHEEWR